MSTNYPNTVDSFPVHADNINEKVAGSHVNNLQDAVSAIQTELGTNPKGAKVDVKTRIGDAETSITNANSSITTLQGRVTTVENTLTNFNSEILSAGNGLVKEGTTINVGGTAGRILVNPDNIDLATSGVTIGTYTKVTVDTYGRVTAGSNPSSLSELGITANFLDNNHKSDVSGHLEATETSAGFLGKDDKKKINAQQYSGFYAYANTTVLNIPATNALTKFNQFNNGSSFIAGEYDTGLSRFTCKTKAGYYYLYTQLMIAGGFTANSKFTMSIFKNGLRIKWHNVQYGVLGGHFIINAQDLMYLDINDYVEVFIACTNASSTYNNSYQAECFFTGFRIN